MLISNSLNSHEQKSSWNDNSFHYNYQYRLKQTNIGILKQHKDIIDSSENIKS